MAAVPSGSSLYLGEGASGATPNPSATTAAALATAEPPTMSTIVDMARILAGSPPVQGGATVFVAVLFCCWLLIRWYDRRKLRSE